MKNFDLQKFMKTPICAFDFQFMIGDIKDFLEFSESNIEQQYQYEINAIASGKYEDEPPGYLTHLEESADHRFKVSLPLRVRYGALIALVTTIEWAVGYLIKLPSIIRPKFKGNENNAIQQLRYLSNLAKIDACSQIDDIEALVHIRNCISHAAGVVDAYKYRDKLPASIARIKGISLDGWHFFGTQVCIEKGVLETHIDRAADLIVSIHSELNNQGRFK